MVQRTVLKVDISCQKCKKKLLKAVSALQGVDKVEIDMAKGTLTVTGDADPYDIIQRSRKAGKFAEVVTIGPPPPPPKPDAQKKPDEKKPEQKKPDEKNPPVYIPVPYNVPYTYPYGVNGYPVSAYDRMAVVHEPNPSCVIL